MVKKSSSNDVVIAELKKLYNDIGQLENPSLIDLGNIYESAIQDARRVVDAHIEKWQAKKKS
jgi:uncharacterized protein (DUF1697 family)